MTVTTNYTISGNGITGSTADAVVALVSDDGIAAPATNLTATASATAGVLNGAYYYTQTFVTALGETAPWPGTATVVNPASKQVDLTAIPLGPSGTIARRIYRTVAGPTDPKDYRYVGEISDNITTTYTDNLADGSLGSAVNWNGTNRGRFRDAAGAKFASFSDQSTALGQGTFNGNTGYASTAVGYQALYANTTGRRNVAVGVYALTALTTAYQNTAVGVHAGGGLTVGLNNTLIGYSAGGPTLAPGNENTVVGSGAFIGTGANLGAQNTAVGYQALSNINTADNCIAIGRTAGKYANASRQIFIDSLERSNIAGCQDSGWLYGEANATVTSQLTRMNSLVRIGCGAAPVVAGLPAASSTYKGYRGYVTDASVAYTSANVGSTVVGGGANVAPVFCTGAAWVIG